MSSAWDPRKRPFRPQFIPVPKRATGARGESQRLCFSGDAILSLPRFAGEGGERKARAGWGKPRTRTLRACCPTRRRKSGATLPANAGREKRALPRRQAAAQQLRVHLVEPVGLPAGGGQKRRAVAAEGALELGMGEQLGDL